MTMQNVSNQQSQQSKAPHVVGVVTHLEGEPQRVRVATKSSCCESCALVLLTSEIREIESVGGGISAIYLVDPLSVSQRLASERLPPAPREGEEQARKHYECSDNVEWECFYDGGWKKCRPVGCC